MEAFDRVKKLVGEDGLNKLKSAHVAVFGIGGVGGFVAEALVRSGVGNITLFDNDTVDITNLNRQLISERSNVGRLKVEVAKERYLAINPQLQIEINNLFYLPENADSVALEGFDYVVDAIDTVSAKLEIISRAKEKNVKVITCMGTAGKLCPTSLKVSDVMQTKGCPLARVMRRELAKRGISGVKAVWSDEQAVKGDLTDKKADGKSVPPSMIFVPGVAGLIIASEVVKDLIGETR